MDAEYSEVEGDDSESVVLNALAGGMPHAFVVATSLDPLDLRVASNYEVDTIRALLTHTLKALPEGD